MTHEEAPGCKCEISSKDIETAIKEYLAEECRVKIKVRLEQITEFVYDNGCIMLNTDICTPEEALRLNDGGILDALSRTLAESIL